MIGFLLLVIIIALGVATLWVFARWVLQLGAALIACGVLYCLIGWPMIILAVLAAIAGVIAGRIAERRGIRAATQRFWDSFNRQP